MPSCRLGPRSRDGFVMTWFGRIVLCVALLTTAIAMQLVVVSRLPFPGVGPDVVLVTVVALALTYGKTTGAVCGFCAGLGMDMAPPADHAMGRTALVLCLVGYAAGAWWRRTPPPARSMPLAIVAIGVAALGACALTLGIAAVVAEAPGDGNGVSDIARAVTTAAFYAVLLACVVVPVLLRRARRRDSDAYLAGLR
jgi:rod shape-determining protein MreD